MSVKQILSGIIEDGTKDVKDGETFVAGIGLSLDSNGQLIATGSNDVKVYGLSRVDKYSPYSDQVSGNLGYSGPGKATVMKKGIVTVAPSYFTATDGSTVKVEVYDSTLSTANVNDKLYIKDGLISTDGTQANTLLGTLNRKPTSSDESIEIDLNL